MRPVSGRFLEAVTGSHPIAVRATVHRPEGEAVEIEVIDGSVTLDSGSPVRGRCDLTLPIDLAPTEPTDLLAPYSNEIQLERGFRFPDGPEYAEIGRFRIEDVEIADDPQGRQLRLQGLDRAQRIVRAVFEEDHETNEGTDFFDAILAMIGPAYPEVPYDFPSRELLTTAMRETEGSDRWAACQDMAAAIGMELYFDGAGVLVMRPIPSPGDEAVAEVSEGDGGVLLEKTTRWTRADAHNVFIWTFENPESDYPPARGVAEDLDPNSPTYVHGPFGRVPKFETSTRGDEDATRAEQQALDAAAGQLAKELGTSKQIDFQAIVNPALEPGDVVRVTRDGTSENHILDSVSIPLTATEGMSAQTRGVLVQ